MFSRRQEELKIESLGFQHEFMEVLRNRHLSWAGDINDNEIASLHLEISELITQVSQKYKRLREMYGRRSE
jgi:hypothetical protein